MAQSLKGVSWGTPSVDETSFAVMVSERGGQKNLLQIPHRKINNSVANKTDVILDISTEDLAAEEDILCEVRFFVQTKEETERREEAAEALNLDILEKAKITDFKGESLCTVNEVSLAVPRGKYIVDFYEKMMRFHGSTFNFSIQYRSVTKAFYLPLPNDLLCLALQVSKPVQLGQTTHHFIVLQFKKEIEVEIKTRVKPQHEENNPALKNVKAEYQGELHEVFPEVVNGFVGINMLLPSTDIKIKEGPPCLKCNFKTHPGWIYFVKKSFLFVLKPTLYIRFEEVAQVEFQRVNSTVNKLFDMTVVLSKVDKKHHPTFVGIDRGHLEPLLEYLKDNGLKVINRTEEKRIQFTKQDIEPSDSGSEDDQFKADVNAEDSSQSFEADEESKMS